MENSVSLESTLELLLIGLVLRMNSNGIVLRKNSSSRFQTKGFKLIFLKLSFSEVSLLPFTKENN